MSQDRREYYKAWYEANKEKHLTQNKAYREANKDKVALRHKTYSEAHKEKIVEYRKIYYQANKEKINVKSNAWTKANKERAKDHQKSSKAKYRWRYNAYSAKRHTAKLNRTPCWLTEADFEKIERKYALARRKTETTGERWDVDHIIPLQGKFVSGLHVPANLRVIKHITNCRKRNHFDLEKEWALS